MKNRILFLGGLCLVLALGLIFIGCDDGPVDHPFFDGVGITVERAGTGEATGTSNNNFLITWSAVEGASGYAVVFRPLGKVDYRIVDVTAETSPGSNDWTRTGTSIAQNTVKYEKNAAGTDFVAAAGANDDLDAWSGKADMNRLFPNNTVGQFGVAVFPLRYDRNIVVVWDDVEYLIP